MGLFVRQAAAMRQVTIPPPAAVMLYLDDFYGGRCKSLVHVGEQVFLGQTIGLPESGGAAVHSSVSGTVRAVGAGAVVIENDGRNAPAANIHPLPTLEGEDVPALLEDLGQKGILTAEHTPLSLPLDRTCPLLALSLLSPGIHSPSDEMLGGFLALVRLLKPKRIALLRNKRQPAYKGLLSQMGLAAEDWPLDPNMPLPLERLTGLPPTRGLNLMDRGCILLDGQGAKAVWDGLYLGYPFILRQVLVDTAQETLAVTVPIGTAVGHILSALELAPTTVLLSQQPLRQIQMPIGKKDAVITCY